MVPHLCQLLVSLFVLPSIQGSKAASCLQLGHCHEVFAGVWRVLSLSHVRADMGEITKLYGTLDDRQAHVDNLF